MTPCLALGLMLLAAPVLPAATPAAPSSPSGAHAFTATMAHAVDAIGEASINDGRTPGVAIGIVADGRIVYARGFGYANLATHQHFDPSTQTYIGGISKQFTAAAVLLLEQEHKLQLADKVSRYVPELKIGPDVTIAELLNQTSGLPDIANAPKIDLDPTHSMKLLQLIDALNTLPMRSMPGKQFANNDFNYMLAGLIVERVSGIPLSDFLQQNIFIPLVMNQSFYAGDVGISPDHAVGYSGLPQHFAQTKAWDPAWLFGSGGVVTNLYDLAKWDLDMPLLLRVDSMREMFTSASDFGEMRYGLGWAIDERASKRYVWHNGQVAGYHAMNAVLPDDHIAVIVLTNIDNMHSHAVVSPEVLAGHVLDIVAPPSVARLDNIVIERAREWLQRIADHHIDRTQLTPQFSSYLTDVLVVRANLSSFGKLQTLIPISSEIRSDGDTAYEFLARFTRDQYHFRFVLTKDGKIDGLFLQP